MTSSPWKVLQSEEINVHRFNITKEQIELPNEEEITFSYINFHHGICVLALTPELEVVLLKEYRHAVKTWEWQLPSGMIEEGEDPGEAAKRELLEETGYEAGRWISLGEFHPSPGSTSETIHLFTAMDAEKKSEKHLESSEEIDVHLMDWQQVLDLVSSGEFKHGGGLAAILKYLLIVDKGAAEPLD
ncbi:ADP-ribose pyrophosphatase [Evansella vedderi]|uniref:ADP-ribose pyrophosphatase n=1 Tax=Evansella vedderi TaxID=38282 RepID=A0ABU0A1R7_9BACI|nr:NUDIX hydrolase [Evansella vedderi]MDQ0256658.1 ADP-ribose pyrophosphatase [Evansella vedderi]